MEDNKNGKSWSIGTFVRVLPNVRKAKTLVEYAHEGDGLFLNYTMS